MRVFSLRHGFIQIPILAVIAALIVTASATIYGQIVQEGRPLETVGTLNLIATPACTGTTPVVNLSWNLLPAETGYVVFRTPAGAYSPQSLGTPNTNQLIDSQVTAGTTYIYTVEGQTTSVRSGFVAATALTVCGQTVQPPQPTPTPTPAPGVQPTPTPTPPAAGQTLSLTALPGCAATTPNIGLFWNQITGAANYLILRDGQALTNSTSYLTVYTDRAVVGGSTHTYQVVTNTGVQSNVATATVPSCQPAGGPVIPVQPTPTPTPIPPVGGTQKPGAFSLTSPANGATGVSNNPSFDWTDSAGANHYLIYIVHSTGSWLHDEVRQSAVSWNNGVGWERNQGTTLEPPQTLTPGKWSWTVGAVNTAGVTWSEQGYFSFEVGGAIQPTTPPAATPPPTGGTTPPGNFSLVSPANQAVGVSNNPDFDWTDSAGAQNYWVYVGQAGPGWLWSKTTTQSQASWDHGSGWQKMEGKNQEPPSSFGDVASAGDAASWSWFVTAVNSAGQTHATKPPGSYSSGPQVFVFTVGQPGDGGFSPVPPGGWTRFYDATGGKPVTINPGDTVQISGSTVEQNTGTPIQDVLIRGSNGYGGVVETRTDAGGNYQLTIPLARENAINPVSILAQAVVLCAETYAQSPSAIANIKTGPGTVPFSVDFSFACVSEIFGQDLVKPIDYTKGVGQIDGFVQTESGKPVAGVGVGLGLGGWPGTTDANGYYIIQLVPAGRPATINIYTFEPGCLIRGVGTITVAANSRVRAPTIIIKDDPRCTNRPRTIGEEFQAQQAAGAGQAGQAQTQAQGGALQTIGKFVKDLFGGGGQTPTQTQTQTQPQPPSGGTASLVSRQAPTLVNEFTWCEGGKAARVRFVWYDAPGAVSHTLIYKTATDKGTVPNVNSIYTMTVDNGQRIESWNIQANFADGTSILADNGPWGGWYADTCKPGTEAPDTEAPTIKNVRDPATSVDFADGTTVSGTKWLLVEASDNKVISHVALYLDAVDNNNLLDTDWLADSESGLFALQFNDPDHRLDNGSRTLYVVAFDEAQPRNASEPKQITVNVQNVAPVRPAPTVGAPCPDACSPAAIRADAANRSYAVTLLYLLSKESSGGQWDAYNPGDPAGGSHGAYQYNMPTWNDSKGFTSAWTDSDVYPNNKGVHPDHNIWDPFGQAEATVQWLNRCQTKRWEGPFQRDPRQIPAHCR